MTILQWHNQLSSKIRGALLFFILLIILDNSTLFDIPISETFTTSSNLSTWLSSKVIGIGFIDSFAFNLVSLHIMLILLLFGVIKAPFRNIWALKFTILSTTFIIFISNYQLIEPNNNIAVLINGSFQSLKLIPILFAYHWTKQLATPIII
ncbi:hypothetical protein [Aureispira anguillae]|uniref:Uncharacterized protein n=1 Tax=Aureispira anguillae TaxID=2864201 RepID=A0A916DRR1_9BACT|nr:hypothetical protein [Aureispira anguillae]BDS11421.1 hypothetical protein AsAng_0021350 [Aureispira anguillae]